MTNDFELLIQAFKKIAETLKSIINFIKDKWESIQKFIASYKHLKKIPIHPTITKGLRVKYFMKSQVLINKPMWIRARSSC